jgi:arylsulfatase A-like enzyme
LALSLVATATVLARSQGSAIASKRPNIVLILTDDQRWDTLWAMPTVRKRLVNHGVTFANSFVVNSLCCPSRSSILTGKYSHSTGVYTNGGPHGGFAAFRDRPTVATRLHGAGYETALVGKYLNGYGGTYIPPGWDQWAAIEMRPPSPTHDYYYDYRLNVNGSIRSYGSDPSDYSTDVLTSQAVRFIDHARSPLFLYLGLWAPHGPPIPAAGDGDTFPNLKPARPPNFNEEDVSDKPQWVQSLPTLDDSRIRAVDRYRRGQLQTLRDVDRSVGRILDALRRTGRLGNTLVVFMSDNGLAWGEHRWTNKQAAYEESIRVPLVIRYDPLTQAPRRTNAPALNVDLAPTFAALAGTSTSGVEGRSLLPILQRRPVSWRTGFLVEHLELWPGAPPPTFCGIRTRRFLYVKYVTGERELYALETDPFELQNRVDDPTLGVPQRTLERRLHNLCDPPPPGMPRP